MIAPAGRATMMALPSPPQCRRLSRVWAALQPPPPPSDDSNTSSASALVGAPPPPPPPPPPVLPAAAAAAAGASGDATGGLRLADVSNPTALTGLGVASPAWSADSHWLAYLWEAGAAGVASSPAGVCEAAAANDGIVRGRELFVVEVGTVGDPSLQPSRVCDHKVAEFVWLPCAGSGASAAAATACSSAACASEDSRRMEKEGSGGLPMLVALTLDGSILLCQVQPRCSCHLLAQLASGAAELGVSPSGEYLSFLVDGDLWVCALEGQGVQMHASTPTQLTHLGAPPISSVPLGTYYGVDAGIGRYVWGSDVPAYTWSPDSQFIAAHYVDRRAVRRTPFPYYLTEETTINWHRRSYPGDDLAGMSEVRGLYVIALPRSKEGSAQRLLQLHAPGVPREQASHLNGFAWRPVATTDLASLGMHLLIDVISDTGQARGLYICNVNRESLCDDAALCDRAKLVWSDFGHSRSYAAVGAGWLPDGNAWLVVDADERMQLGVLPLDASDGVHTVRMLTVAADGDVVGERGAAPVCASENGKLFYTRNAPNAECRPVYCVDGNGTAPPQLCTGQVGGCHVPFTSPDGAWLATVHSADTVPPRLSLFCVGKLSSHKTATTALTELPSCFTMGRLGKLCTPEYVHFPSEDGRYTLRGRLLRPVSGGHGGALVGPVYSNTVRCSWGRWSLLLHWLVQRGWTVLQVDVRGSAGNSRAFRDEFACDVGGRDLDDVAAAAQFLRGLPTVAPDRVGMWGSSYGGTLTCMALFRRPRLLNAGVACAPATHAHFFGPDDVAVVRHPEVAGGSPGRAMDENYARNSAITSAAGLCRPLLVIHGMQDDVVPFKTTLMLAEQLMLAGNRMFELATAPAATHDWAAQPHVAAYLYTRLLAHFERHLLGISDPHRIDSY